jgi:hypothetical protein
LPLCCSFRAGWRTTSSSCPSSSSLPYGLPCVPSLSIPWPRLLLLIRVCATENIYDALWLRVKHNS